MTDTLVLFLPRGDEGYRWLRVAGDRVTARGEGLPDPAAGVAADVPTVAVAPAEAVTLHWAELPDRSPAQAIAAARLLVAEASAAPLAELHVAVGRDEAVKGGGDGAGDRAIGVVAASQMRAWLARLAADGVDPDRLVPAPMLLPRPAEGYVRAELGGQGVVRGRSSGFADEALLTDLVIADAPAERLAHEATEAALMTALVAPALDLRQGVFARRRAFAIDGRAVRRLVLLALGVLAATLAIDLVRIARFSWGADRLEVRADELARGGLPRGETVNDADRQLAARLAGLRGPGLGFTRTAAVAFGALRAVPGTELTGLDFDGTGALRLSVATQGEGQAAALKQRLEQAGFAVTASVFTAANGRLTGQLTAQAGTAR